jgi:hypothetical protein
VSKNRVLRKIHGSERVNVKGGLEKMYNEELDDLYCPQHIGKESCSVTCHAGFEER